MKLTAVVAVAAVVVSLLLLVAAVLGGGTGTCTGFAADLERVAVLDSPGIGIGMEVDVDVDDDSCGVLKLLDRLRALGAIIGVDKKEVEEDDEGEEDEGFEGSGTAIIPSLDDTAAEN